MGKGGNIDTRIAKTVASTDFEDEEVRVAGDNARRRIAAANSRNRAMEAANTYWASLMSVKPRGGGNPPKQTLG